MVVAKVSNCRLYNVMYMYVHTYIYTPNLKEHKTDWLTLNIKLRALSSKSVSEVLSPHPWQKKAVYTLVNNPHPSPPASLRSFTLHSDTLSIISLHCRKYTCTYNVAAITNVHVAMPAAGHIIYVRTLDSKFIRSLFYTCPQGSSYIRTCT